MNIPESCDGHPSRFPRPIRSGSLDWICDLKEAAAACRRGYDVHWACVNGWLPKLWHDNWHPLGQLNLVFYADICLYSCCKLNYSVYGTQISVGWLRTAGDQGQLIEVTAIYLIPWMNAKDELVCTSAQVAPFHVTVFEGLTGKGVH